MCKAWKWLLCAGILPMGLPEPASASLIIYTATDVGAGPTSARPNSTAAAANFTAGAATLGPLATLTFESAPVGSFSTLTVAPGVSLSGSDYLGNNQQILNAPDFPSNPAVDGFNTTAGGSKYVEVTGGTLTFSFAAGVQFFGAYVTGVQSTFFNDTLTFSDGTSQTISITNPSAMAGGVTFLGFTDAGRSITSLTINAGTATTGADFIGVDDVTYQATAVPEPASSLLVGTGFVLGTTTTLLRRRSARMRRRGC